MVKLVQALAISSMMNEVLLKFRINEAVVSYKLYTQLASLVKLFIMDGFS